jgi:K+ transporter
VLFIANIAALIASRTMITATFACINKSIALGCFPRLKIIHTSRKFMGQIYIPFINWFLMIFCALFLVSFRSVDDIGVAYGNSSQLITNGFGIYGDICYTTSTMLGN